VKRNENLRQETEQNSVGKNGGVYPRSVKSGEECNNKRVPRGGDFYQSKNVHEVQTGLKLKADFVGLSSHGQPLMSKPRKTKAKSVGGGGDEHSRRTTGGLVLVGKAPRGRPS